MSYAVVDGCFEPHKLAKQIEHAPFIELNISCGRRQRYRAILRLIERNRLRGLCPMGDKYLPNNNDQYGKHNRQCNSTYNARFSLRFFKTEFLGIHSDQSYLYAEQCSSLLLFPARENPSRDGRGIGGDGLKGLSIQFEFPAFGEMESLRGRPDNIPGRPRFRTGSRGPRGRGVPRCRGQIQANLENFQNCFGCGNLRMNIDRKTVPTELATENTPARAGVREEEN